MAQEVPLNGAISSSSKIARSITYAREARGRNENQKTKGPRRKWGCSQSVHVRRALLPFAVDIPLVQCRIRRPPNLGEREEGQARGEGLDISDHVERLELSLISVVCQKEKLSSRLHKTGVRSLFLFLLPFVLLQVPSSAGNCQQTLMASHVVPTVLGGPLFSFSRLPQSFFLGRYVRQRFRGDLFYILNSQSFSGRVPCFYKSYSEVPLDMRAAKWRRLG